MDLSRDVPADIDFSRPSAARVYDYFLGGVLNFEVDRRLAAQITALTPHLPDTMRAGRAFLRRAVRFLASEGIDQYLDIGSGIPTAGNVHEVAQAANPAARVVYVDIDPVAIAHSKSILEGNDLVDVIHADLREPERILAETRRRGLLDLDRPVAVLLGGVVHFVPDSDRPDEIVTTLRDATAPGSYLVIYHATHEDQPQEMLTAQKLSAHTATEMTVRSHARIAGYFGDFTLVEPGLVHLPLWRPETPDDVADDPAQSAAFGGVGRKAPG